MSILRNTENLRSIEIHGNRLSKNVFKYIHKHSIKILKLYNFKDTIKEEFFPIDWSENLKEISLQNCSFKRNISRLSSKIQKINRISCTDIFKYCKNLVKLDVSYTDFNDYHLDCLSLNMIFIENLNLQSSNVTNICSLLRLKFLKVLNYSDCFPNVNTVNVLCKLTNLEWLRLSQPPIDNNVNMLVDILKNCYWKNLQYFDFLYSTSLGKNSIQTLK